MKDGGQRDKEAKVSDPRDLSKMPDATGLLSERRETAAARMRNLRKRRKAESCCLEHCVAP